MGQDIQDNKPLTGSEFCKIILKKVADILSQDGMLAGHIAHREASFQVVVKIKTTNPMISGGYWNNKISSVDSTPQQIAQDPSLAAIKTFPHPSEEGDDDHKFGVMQQIDVISPNQSRVENGIPVPIQYKSQEGEIKEESVMYDIDVVDPNSEFADKIAQRELSEEEFDSEEI